MTPTRTCRTAAVRWLVIVAVTETLCAVIAYSLVRGDQNTVLMTGWPGLLSEVMSVAVVVLLPHAVWRVWREQRRDRLATDHVSQLMDTVLSTSREWLWSVDSSGVFIFSSPASRNLIGYDPAELIGQHCSLVMDLGELSRAQAVIQALGGPESGWSGRVMAARHRNATTTWLDVAGRPRHNADGQAIGFQGASRPLDPDAANAADDERVRARIEAMLTSRLLMTAFQPIVALATGSVVGVEALTRFIAEPAATPDVWFTDAASVGLGTQLELLAIQTALTAAAQLPEHLYISINASPATCLDRKLADLITQGPIAAQRIVLELTEHIPVTDYEPLSAAMNCLRHQGLRLAVDDAGAGFASFRHILQLKPDLIKLDRDIITTLDTDPARRALAAAIVSFATHICAHVIAEGIENPAELRTATELGMTAGQGYHLGRPSINPREWARWQPNTPAPTRPTNPTDPRP